MKITTQQLVERIRHAATLIESKGISGTELVSVSVDGWGCIDIHVEVETLLDLFPQVVFEGRHGSIYDIESKARFCACICASECLATSPARSR